MDRALLERMVGAVALVLLLVIIAPALLDGSSESGAERFVKNTDGKEVRTQVIVLNEPHETETAGGSDPEVSTDLPKAITTNQPVATAKATEPLSNPIKPSVVPIPAPVQALTPATVSEQRVDIAASTPVTVATKPKQKAVTEQPVSPAGSTAGSSPVTGFAVQLGSFGKLENAEKYATQLGSRGFAVFLRSSGSTPAAVHRVYAGPRPTRDAAEKLAAVINDAGYKGIVVDLSSDPGNGGR